VLFRIYALRPDSAEREGEAVLETTTNESGAWGPLRLRSGLEYEFELMSEGRKVTYFMSGVVRSTALLNFRFLPAGAMQGGRLLIHRPNGYLSKGRDPLTVNGEPVAELLPGVPTRDSVAVKATAGNLRVELRGERIYARPTEVETDTHVASLIWE
jgi:triacylglycerol lipase